MTFQIKGMTANCSTVTCGEGCSCLAQLNDMQCVPLHAMKASVGQEVLIHPFLNKSTVDTDKMMVASYP